jgi:arginyl-tRNA synthetase
MHVGHLRSAIIGETLKRIYKFVGYNVISDVHLGDWGLQMGMIISELELKSIDYNSLNILDLEQMYPKISKECKSNKEREKLAKEAVIKLQSDDEYYKKIWSKIVEISTEKIKISYKLLNVSFDLWYGESTIHDQIEPLVLDLIKNGYAIKDLDSNSKTYGCTIIEKIPLILYTSDGSVIYPTTDLTTISDRIKKFNPDKIIYVVDQRQNLHFKEVFDAARKCNIVSNDLDLICIGYGTMNGVDGKPFRAVRILNGGFFYKKLITLRI